MPDPSTASHRRIRVDRIRTLLLVLAFAAALLAPAAARAQISLVRMQGVLGGDKVPGSFGTLTLSIGTKNVPFHVLSAQKISGSPAMAPEIFSALGPGPPPVRVQGRKGMTKKILSAPPGTHMTITGNLNFATPMWTLMQVSPDKSAGTQ
jgi:hypothetical protein